MHKEYEVEFLQAEIKQKLNEYAKFLLGKEQNHQEFTASDKEIEKLVAQMQELENRSNEVLETISWLEQQLQRIKKVVRELKENEERLQQQQYNNQIQMSALQFKLDDTRHGYLQKASLIKC